MTTEQAIAFLLFATVVAVTPGPSNLILTTAGASVGVLRGLPSLLGAAVGVGSMMFVAAYGLGRVVLENALLLQILRWCGIAFLLWLSWKIATSGRSEAGAGRFQLGFWPLAVFQWINPKVWLACASAVGTYLRTEAGTAFNQSFSLALLFVLAAVPSFLVWLVFGAALQRLLQSERTARRFNLVMGVLLAASVVFIIK